MKKLMVLVMIMVILFTAGAFVGCDNRARAGEYQEIFTAVKAGLPKKEPFQFGCSGNQDDMMPEADNSDEKKPDYSDTNLQVLGVQEADIVKTDGEYIYAISSKFVNIVRVQGEILTLTASLNRQSTDESMSTCEMYILGDKMILLGYEIQMTNTEGYREDVIDGMFFQRNGYWHSLMTRQNTTVEVYDIANRTAPIRVAQYKQSGAYQTSRMVGDFLYVISDYYVGVNIKPQQPQSYVPVLETNGTSTALPVENILLPEGVESARYLVATGFDTKFQSERISAQAVLGGSENVYCTADSLYVARNSDIKQEKYHSSATELMRFSLMNGMVTFSGKGKVFGHLVNQFAMDEYKGNLRVVTSVDRWYFQQREDQDPAPRANALYILDGEMKTVGSIEDIAPTERVYSVRFMGDIGYFVTFRRTDPLFAVDLSVPTLPKILSALKIPGFSEYLHPFGEGRLFGFGKSADEDGRVQGLKLSMFDISHPEAVTERHTKNLYDNFYAEASTNHKAILIHVEKNLIGFAADARYYVYSYGDDGFIERKVVQDLGCENRYYDTMRGLYIGEYFYIVHANGIRVFALNDFSASGSMHFN